jgi:hypothetical protein
LKRSAQRLSAATVCDLHNGDTASATTNLCTLLALVQGERDERILISQLVRFAMASIAASANWELLQSTNLTDAELEELQKSWERLKFIPSLEGAILMERASTENTIQTLRTSKTEFDRLMGYYGGSATFPASSGDWWGDAQNFAKAGAQKLVLGGETFMWQASWSYSDELRALQGNQIVLSAIREAETNQILYPIYSKISAQFGLMGITNIPGDETMLLDMPDLRWLFSESITGLGSSFHRAIVAETSRRVVITAIALKRFQLQHGIFPEKLSELTPEFLSSVPLDPIDGKPLRYKKNSDGTFLLYSIGDNDVDDGGDPTYPTGVTGSSFYWQNYHARDWVWPQPATPAEVQYFYEHPPK